MRSIPWAALALVSALSLLCACEDAPSPDVHSVVLVTLDTTRADVLTGFGGGSRIAPTLEALCAESVRFTRAHTVAPLTLPAHSSMFTGLYPPRHGVRANGPARLSQAADTLAERALRAGFQTAGFVGALALDHDYGIAQGFEAWTQPEEGAGRVTGQISDRPASDVLFDARAWLSQRDHRRPFFLWVHLFDPHAPYSAAPRFVAQAGGSPYHGEVASLDEELGLLVEHLRDEGFFERGSLLVVGDHGEGLGEHGEDTHGLHVWEPTLRVPFFLRLAGGARAGEECRDFTSVVDVAPTLAELMGLPAVPGLDGISLLAAPVPGRGTYFEALSGWARFRWSPLCGWIGPEGKYVHSSTPRLWALRGNEEENGAPGQPATVERAQRAIRAVLDAPALPRGKLSGSSRAQAAIAALGYGSAGELEPEYPDPLEPTDLPSPDERLEEYRLFVAAQTLHQTGRLAEAAEKLEALVAANPRSVHALDELAQTLVDLERWPRAIEVLQQRLLFAPDRLSTHQWLVQCFTATGDEARAHEHTRRALALLVELALQRGQPAEAEHYRELLRQDERPEVR